jgi:mono/diheme cytochrome c family protein
MNQTQTTPLRPQSFLQRLAAAGVVWAAVCAGVWPIGLPAAASEPLSPDGGGQQAELAGFQATIEPLFQAACLDCHGPDASEGNFRIDTLDPDLINGGDVEWWLDVYAVLSKGEMPPAEAEPLADTDRVTLVNWLSGQLRQASLARQAAGGRSSQRRMTRYEYGYALQDLLGLPFDFARDLPPDAASTDGFENGADTLQLSASTFMAYHKAAREAVERATVRGEQPSPLFWTVTMQEAAKEAWPPQEAALEAIRHKHEADEASTAEQLQQELDHQLATFQAAHPQPYHKQLASGRTSPIQWSYPEAKHAWLPADTRAETPGDTDVVAVIPPRQKLTVELGDRVADAGILEVRLRVSRPADAEGPPPSVQLEFGWQASNDSQASVRVSPRDEVVEAPPSAPQAILWRLEASEILPRNNVRGINKLGDLPNPSEFLRVVNSTASTGELQLHSVEVAGPLYDTWPPQSHTRLFGGHELSRLQPADEKALARELLAAFMTRAWRREVSGDEIDRKLQLFALLRPQAEDFQEAMLEAYAAVIASPHFLAVGGEEPLAPSDLATRLSVFLWCSLPDEQLRQRAADGSLASPGALAEEARRLLADPRSRRFCEQFTRQWLGLDRLDYLEVDRGRYPSFHPLLAEAMQDEPTAFFVELLQTNGSVLDLLAADYVLVNERLARHYGITGVVGNEFRQVLLGDARRGGLLTQAGLLAMNADGVDSHPLKRGVWLLERLLDDPPPPPPPAVPRIDLADPEIAKLTLKERLLDHRNQAACRSCHERIDPWGIALENFDAIGGWREEVGGQPVDATSTLFNGQQLDGVAGLKRYLLEARAGQFRRAVIAKLSRYALGRPLTFADHAQVEAIAADLDERGDGLATMIELIVESDLFRSQAVAAVALPR